MRLLLLQGQVWVPSLGGGNKANRLLFEALARRGHDCAALCRAITSRAGPTSEAELLAEMSRRGVPVEIAAPGSYAFHHRGVDVEAMDFSIHPQIADRVAEFVETFQPDWIVVSDGRRREFLEGALRAAPERTVMLVQTVNQLPFGPLALESDARQTELFHRVRAVIVISEFVRRYVERYAGRDPHLLRLPVYGEGPFEDFSNFAEGYLTMINPCVEKGLPIFLALAAERTDLRFAAVPTWGTDSGVLRALEAAPNIDILEPEDAIQGILGRTRILLAPSLWPETFGYVVVEAMLHGIPVLASDIGGLSEAKLGVDYLLPVAPAVRRDGSYESPDQDIEPWSKAVEELLSDVRVYGRCSRQSRAAAVEFVAPISERPWEKLLAGLATGE